MIFLDACNDSGILSTILFLKEMFNVICIIVPIILIIMLSIELMKIVMGNADKNIGKVVKSITMKAIAAVLVFFVPTFINLLLNLLDSSNISVTTCWKNANNVMIAELRSKEEARKLQEQYDLNKEKEEAKKEREKISALREEQRKVNEEKAKEARFRKVPSVVYYGQCLYPWANQPFYGGSTMCNAGCGPTSAAIVASTYLGRSGHNPIDAKNWICSKKGACDSSGTNFFAIRDYLKSLGFEAYGEYYYDSHKDLLYNKIATGKYMAIVIVSNKTGRNMFTRNWHYLVITGLKNGKFTIAQPSREYQNNYTYGFSAFDGDAATFYLFAREG